jgi:hypothetical protein
MLRCLRVPAGSGTDAFDFDSDLLAFSAPSNRHSHYPKKAEASSGREIS